MWKDFKTAMGIKEGRFSVVSTAVAIGVIFLVSFIKMNSALQTLIEILCCAVCYIEVVRFTRVINGLHETGVKGKKKG